MEEVSDAALLLAKLIKQGLNCAAGEVRLAYSDYPEHKGERPTFIVEAVSQKHLHSGRRFCHQSNQYLAEEYTTYQLTVLVSASAAEQVKTAAVKLCDLLYAQYSRDFLAKHKASLNYGNLIFADEAGLKAKRVSLSLVIRRQVADKVAVWHGADSPLVTQE
ncbi:MAG: hypothetical protein FWE37_05230 [Spirochaetaceae bacterium]|nr:hypothetical protein [Spirochaetaceae bacterium]